jgi:hypothetical protein
LMPLKLSLMAFLLFIGVKIITVLIGFFWHLIYLIW